MYSMAIEKSQGLLDGRNTTESRGDNFRDLVNSSITQGPDATAVETLFLEAARSILHESMVKFNKKVDRKRSQNQLRSLASLAKDYASSRVSEVILFAISIVKAYGHYKYGDWSSVIKCLNAAITNCPIVNGAHVPGLTDALVMLAEAFNSMARYEDALHSARLAVSTAHEQVEDISLDVKSDIDYFRTDVITAVGDAICPLLDPSTALAVSYATLAQQLESNGLAPLAAEWYERALNVALKFQQDDAIIDMLEDSLSRSQLLMGGTTAVGGSGKENSVRPSSEIDKSVLDDGGQRGSKGAGSNRSRPETSSAVTPTGSGSHLQSMSPLRPVSAPSMAGISSSSGLGGLGELHFIPKHSKSQSEVMDTTEGVDLNEVAYVDCGPFDPHEDFDITPPPDDVDHMTAFQTHDIEADFGETVISALTAGNTTTYYRSEAPLDGEPGSQAGMGGGQYQPTLIDTLFVGSADAPQRPPTHQMQPTRSGAARGMGMGVGVGNEGGTPQTDRSGGSVSAIGIDSADGDAREAGRRYGDGGGDGDEEIMRWITVDYPNILQQEHPHRQQQQQQQQLQHQQQQRQKPPLGVNLKSPMSHTSLGALASPAAMSSVPSTLVSPLGQSLSSSGSLQPQWRDKWQQEAPGARPGTGSATGLDAGGLYEASRSSVSLQQGEANVRELIKSESASAVRSRQFSQNQQIPQQQQQQQQSVSHYQGVSNTHTASAQPVSNQRGGPPSMIRPASMDSFMLPSGSMNIQTRDLTSLQPPSAQHSMELRMSRGLDARTGAVVVGSKAAASPRWFVPGARDHPKLHTSPSAPSFLPSSLTPHLGHHMPPGAASVQASSQSVGAGDHDDILFDSGFEAQSRALPPALEKQRTSSAQEQLLSRALLGDIRAQELAAQHMPMNTITSAASVSPDRAVRETQRWVDAQTLENEKLRLETMPSEFTRVNTGEQAAVDAALAATAAVPAMRQLEIRQQLEREVLYQQLEEIKQQAAIDRMKAQESLEAEKIKFREAAAAEIRLISERFNAELVKAKEDERRKIDEERRQLSRRVRQSNQELEDEPCTEGEVRRGDFDGDVDAVRDDRGAGARAGAGLGGIRILQKQRRGTGDSGGSNDTYGSSGGGDVVTNVLNDSLYVSVLRQRSSERLVDGRSSSPAHIVGSDAMNKQKKLSPSQKLITSVSKKDLSSSASAPKLRREASDKLRPLQASPGGKKHRYVIHQRRKPVVGTRVECLFRVHKYGARSRWYKARVIAVWPDETYDVQYDNGEKEHGVRSSDMRLLDVTGDEPEHVRDGGQPGDTAGDTAWTTNEQPGRLTAKQLREKNSQEMHAAMDLARKEVAEMARRKREAELQLRAAKAVKIQALARGVVCRKKQRFVREHLIRTRRVRHREKELEERERSFSLSLSQGLGHYHNESHRVKNGAAAAAGGRDNIDQSEHLGKLVSGGSLSAINEGAHSSSSRSILLEDLHAIRLEDSRDSEIFIDLPSSEQDQDHELGLGQELGLGHKALAVSFKIERHDGARGARPSSQGRYSPNSSPAKLQSPSVVTSPVLRQSSEQAYSLHHQRLSAVASSNRSSLNLSATSLEDCRIASLLSQAERVHAEQQRVLDLERSRLQSMNERRDLLFEKLNGYKETLKKLKRSEDQRRRVLEQKLTRDQEYLLDIEQAQQRVQEHLAEVSRQPVIHLTPASSPLSERFMGSRGKATDKSTSRLSMSLSSRRSMELLECENLELLPQETEITKSLLASIERFPTVSHASVAIISPSGPSQLYLPDASGRLVRLWPACEGPLSSDLASSKGHDERDSDRHVSVFMVPLKPPAQGGTHLQICVGVGSKTWTKNVGVADLLAMTESCESLPLITLEPAHQPVLAHSNDTLTASVRAVEANIGDAMKLFVELWEVHVKWSVQSLLVHATLAELVGDAMVRRIDVLIDQYGNDSLLKLKRPSSSPPGSAAAAKSPSPFPADELRDVMLTGRALFSSFIGSAEAAEGTIADLLHAWNLSVLSKQGPNHTAVIGRHEGNSPHSQPAGSSSPAVDIVSSLSCGLQTAASVFHEKLADACIPQELDASRLSGLKSVAAATTTQNTPTLSVKELWGSCSGIIRDSLLALFRSIGVSSSDVGSACLAQMQESCSLVMDVAVQHALRFDWSSWWRKRHEWLCTFEADQFASILYNIEASVFVSSGASFASYDSSFRPTDMQSDPKFLKILHSIDDVIDSSFYALTAESSQGKPTVPAIGAGRGSASGSDIIQEESHSSLPKSASPESLTAAAAGYVHSVTASVVKAVAAPLQVKSLLQQLEQEKASRLALENDQQRVHAEYEKKITQVTSASAQEVQRQLAATKAALSVQYEVKLSDLVVEKELQVRQAHLEAEQQRSALIAEYEEKLAQMESERRAALQEVAEQGKRALSDLVASRTIASASMGLSQASLTIIAPLGFTVNIEGLDRSGRLTFLSPVLDDSLHFTISHCARRGDSIRTFVVPLHRPRGAPRSGAKDTGDVETEVTVIVRSTDGSVEWSRCVLVSEIIELTADTLDTLPHLTLGMDVNMGRTFGDDDNQCEDDSLTVAVLAFFGSGAAKMSSDDPVGVAVVEGGDSTANSNLVSLPHSSPQHSQQRQSPRAAEAKSVPSANDYRRGGGAAPSHGQREVDRLVSSTQPPPLQHEDDLPWVDEEVWVAQDRGDEKENEVAQRQLDYRSLSFETEVVDLFQDFFVAHTDWSCQKLLLAASVEQHIGSLIMNTLDDAKSGEAFHDNRPPTLLHDKQKAIDDLARLLQSGRMLLQGIEADILQLAHYAANLKVRSSEDDSELPLSPLRSAEYGGTMAARGSTRSLSPTRPSSAVKIALLEPMKLMSKAFAAVYSGLVASYYSAPPPLSSQEEDRIVFELWTKIKSSIYSSFAKFISALLGRTRFADFMQALTDPARSSSRGHEALLRDVEVKCTSVLKESISRLQDFDWQDFIEDKAIWARVVGQSMMDEIMDESFLLMLAVRSGSRRLANEENSLPKDEEMIFLSEESPVVQLISNSLMHI